LLKLSRSAAESAYDECGSVGLSRTSMTCMPAGESDQASVVKSTMIGPWGDWKYHPSTIGVATPLISIHFFPFLSLCIHYIYFKEEWVSNLVANFQFLRILG
jgi:hypothetical protein